MGEGVVVVVVGVVEGVVMVVVVAVFRVAVP